MFGFQVLWLHVWWKWQQSISLSSNSWQTKSTRSCCLKNKCITQPRSQLFSSVKTCSPGSVWQIFLLHRISESGYFLGKNWRWCLQTERNHKIRRSPGLSLRWVPKGKKNAVSSSSSAEMLQSATCRRRFHTNSLQSVCHRENDSTSFRFQFLQRRWMKIAHQHTDSEEEDEVFLFFLLPSNHLFYLPPCPVLPQERGQGAEQQFIK